jgi:hypothetical protein
VWLRVRYFTEGLALGGKEFVEAVFAENRERYSAKSKEAARPIAEVEGGGGYVLRRLRRKPMG